MELELVAVVSNVRRIVHVLLLDLPDVSGIDDQPLEELRLGVLVGLLHDILVAELGLDFLDALHIGVSYLTVFGTVTFLNLVGPLDAVELQEKVKDEERVDNVDEGEPDPALSLQVLGQVEVVVLVFELALFLDDLEQVLLSELDWNILDHQGCLLQHFFVAVLAGIQDSFEVDFVVLEGNEGLLHLHLGLIVIAGLLWLGVNERLGLLQCWLLLFVNWDRHWLGLMVLFLWSLRAL